MSEEKGKTMNYGKVSTAAEDQEVPTTEDRKPADKVISGVVIERKQGLGSKIRDTFMGVSAREVGQHVVMDVILPQLKGMAVDAGTQAIERLILGEARRTTSSSSSSASRVRGSNYVAYNRFSGQGGSESEPVANFRSNEVREVIVETRGDAQNVLDELFRHIDRYNAVSVAYYYELVGITGKFTDHQWGWTNLNASGVSHVREGYRIELPKPISIK